MSGFNSHTLECLYYDNDLLAIYSYKINRMPSPNPSRSLTINVRLTLVATSILSYVGLCFLFYPKYGTSAAALVILPVIVSGWSFGLRVGLLAGLVFCTFNVLALSLTVERPVGDIIRESALGYLMTIAVGMGVSRLHDLGERLRQELNRRAQVEAALQESEIRFRTLVEQSPFSTQIFRPDGSVITVNQAFCTLWNASPAEAQYVIKNYNILKDEQLERNGLMPFIRRGFTEGFTEIPAIEYNPQKTTMVKETDLTTKWVVGYIWPVRDEQGRVQQVVLTHQDITERKQVEAQQLELALAHERADLMKELLNTLSHDLKTPLSIINTSLYLLEKASDPAYQKTKTETIREQVQRLNKMIQDILTTSYLETAADSSIQPFNINTIVNEIWEEFSVVAENRSITLELVLDPTLPSIPVNDVEFRRVLINLVENALHYTPRGGRVTIRTLTTAHQIAVEVRDTGIGIEQEDLPYIFDHFYRADKARATHNGGTGLGLAITQKIIKRHQGKIDVESTPGQGTCFRVWLPILQEESSRQ